jgi:hypothetical protein
MKLVNKVEIKLENFEKCHVISDQDCPLGQLYDYSCAFKAFLAQKIQENEAQAKSEVKVEEPAV